MAVADITLMVVVAPKDYNVANAGVSQLLAVTI